jgi:uncharacterized protein (DUF1778 family)
VPVIEPEAIEWDDNNIHRQRDPESMSEEELAEYYYAHRDELAGEEVPSRKPRRLDVMISARFTPEEAGVVRAAAHRAGLSVSAYLRLRALGEEAANVVDLDQVRKDLAAARTVVDHALRALG